MEAVFAFLSDASIGTILVVAGLGLFLLSVLKNISWLQIVDTLRLVARVLGIGLIASGIWIELGNPGIGDDPSDNVSTPSASSSPTTPSTASPSTFVVHVSSVSSQSRASVSHREIRRQFTDLLTDYSSMVEPIDVPGRGRMYRVNYGPFASKDTADQVCLRIQMRTGYCAVLPIGNSVVTEN